MKKALRAASVFLSGKQRSKLHSFLQAPFTGNYNAQSGEIVGVIKNMLDTFEANLESARQEEEKKQKEYDEFMELKTAEYDEMEELFEAKKKEIGDNAAQIATISSEVETMEAELAADQEFLAALTERCESKKKEFEKRNMLRAGEEAAIAEAISILNSDAAFESFGKVDATSTGATGFIQLSETPDLRKKASRELILASRKMHSVRVARIAMAISDGNPFKKVLEMINKTIGIIEAEEADDVEKKETCIKEQEENEAAKKDKETDIQTLESNIDALKVAIEGTEASITLATEDLALNRDSQASRSRSSRRLAARSRSALASTPPAGSSPPWRNRASGTTGTAATCTSRCSTACRPPTSPRSSSRRSSRSRVSRTPSSPPARARAGTRPSTCSSSSPARRRRKRRTRSKTSRPTRWPTSPRCRLSPRPRRRSSRTLTRTSSIWRPRRSSSRKPRRT